MSQDDSRLVVTLTALEIGIAAGIGCTRQIESRSQRRVDHSGKGVELLWEHDINGAIGEYVVAKSLNVFPDVRLGTFKLPDIGKLQVRTTVYSNGSLLVRTHDSPDDYFVLVVGVRNQLFTYRIAGCLRGYDAMQPQWLTDKGNGREPQYFVPQSALEPFKTRAEFDAL
jgi:hypothetical protein